MSQRTIKVRKAIQTDPLNEPKAFQIDLTDQEFANQVGQLISNDLARFFPDGLPVEYADKMEQAMINCFWNSSRWTEEMLRADDLRVKAEAAGLVI